MQTADSYNLFLFHKRTALGLGMRAFARKLGIGWFRYRLIENGYIKPSARDVKKISAALEMDYAPYTVGAASYPGEKKTVRKLGRITSRLLGSKVFRAVLLAICAVCLVTVILARADYSRRGADRAQYLSAECRELCNALIEQGSSSLSLTRSFTRPCVWRAEEDRFVSLKSEYTPSRFGSLEFQTVYWRDTHRFILNLTNDTMTGYLIYVTITDLETGKETLCLYSPEEGLIGSEAEQPWAEEIRAWGEGFFADYDALVREDLGLDVSMEQLFAESEVALSENNRAASAAELREILFLLLLLAAVFLLLYAFVYGTKNGKERVFSYPIPADRPGKRKVPTDLRFCPFIPETVFELLGIALLTVASLRYQIYLALAFIPGVGISISEIKSIYDLFMLFFYAGMFLLYFIDFDLFLDDRRVIRNIFGYLLAFVGVYRLELIFLNALNEDSLLFGIIEYRLPNMFGTIAMYFLIMYLLYFTPKFVNTKRKLIFFRSLSVLPVIVIFGTYFIFHGASSVLGWNLPDWALYLFASERLPFSLLCVLYLFGLYFLRLFFARRYGEEVAERFFLGNRFLFCKNLLICVITLVIAAADLLLSFVPGAKAWGFGYTYFAVFMIPLLLFYHPRKGPRNRFLDYATLLLYFLAFTGVLSLLIHL